MYENISTQNRDYSSISPSAKSLLLLKGLTDIPFARQVAELISKPQIYTPDYSQKNFAHWARVLHFENRYRSINQLLAGLPITNILELSSGFSFRGLAAIQDKELYYIDTDLPEIAATKQAFINELQKDIVPKGKLEIQPLNALDEPHFKELVSHFPAGEVAIVNEGLLMYLGMNEKKALCKIIRDVLKARGGYWITADIYTNEKQGAIRLKMDDKLQRFFEEHNIEANMFDSFETAETFFKNEGFVVDREAEPEYAQLGALKYLLESATDGQIESLGKMGKVQATWRLKLAE